MLTYKHFNHSETNLKHILKTLQMLILDKQRSWYLNGSLNASTYVYLLTSLKYLLNLPFQPTRFNLNIILDT